MTAETFELLRFAIVSSACIDYNTAHFNCSALEKRKRTESENAALTRAKVLEAECLDFFHSDWYTALCGIDPDTLIRKLNVHRLKVKEYDLCELRASARRRAAHR